LQVVNAVRPNYVSMIAQSLQLKANQIKATIGLLDEGNTIPFIARYRKEMTGELDETQLRDIEANYELEKSLYARKNDVLRLLNDQGLFCDDKIKQVLTDSIQSAVSLTEIDDIYRPYRPKRKTRASMAKERGLQPLADWIRDCTNRYATEAIVEEVAAKYISESVGDVSSIEEAIQGALDIVAEEIADDAVARKWLRRFIFKNGLLQSTARDNQAESVYEGYYKYQERLEKVVPHRILAMNRGEREEFLRLSIHVTQDEILSYLFNRLVGENRPDIQKSSEASIRHTSVGRRLYDTVTDAYKRLLSHTMEREVRAELTNHAEEQAVSVFGGNLHNLLMQAPIRGRVVLGVDPAYRTGCKLAVVDDIGKVLEIGVIYPTPPLNKVEAAKAETLRIIDKYHISLIAIGNGTASRETETFILDCIKIYQQTSQQFVPYVMVSEAGASVYSASPLAREEFPNLDVSQRSAISIARRLQDPLAELVKIDPKSVGVGQYQHDVSQKFLDAKLATVVESAVNQVGVDVNTASPSLLSYVAGLNKTVALNIVLFREQNGRFKSRKALAKVPRLGKKTLEQCVGFLRIMDGEEPLDSTPIHPESYDIANQLLRQIADVNTFFQSSAVRMEEMQKLRQRPIDQLATEMNVGTPTLQDILDALERPGRDIRDDIPAPILRTDVLNLEDLSEGMVLTGTIRNVVDFGAFVDIGLKNDGLVHISQLSNQYIKHPMTVVSVGDVVQVRVIQIDTNRGRVGLSMRGM